jgi:uncharacterized protein (UPF0248 family)
MKTGIVYQIVCNVSKERYVGSTSQPIDERLRHHTKQDCSSREIIARDNYTASVLEEIQFNEIAELRKLEQDYMDKLPCINKRKAYIKDKGRQNTEYRAKYRAKNREALNAKSECECGGRYSHNNIHSHQKSQKHQAFIKEQKAHQEVPS